MNPELLQLIQLARTGNRQEALFRLRNYLLEHLDDAEGWTVLGGLTPDPDEGIRALERALDLDPASVMAQRGLTARRAALQTAAPPPPPTVAEAPPETPPLAPPVPAIPPEPVIEPPSLGEAPGAEEPAEFELLEGELAVLEEEEEAEAFEAEEEAEDFSEPVPQKRGGREESAGEPMSLRQALGTSWPFRPRGSSRRTLGDFIDAGLITRQDLEWTIRHAREARVRTAAQVAAEQIHRLPLVSLTEGEARLISWPFRRLNRPLGELVDTAVITAKDLRWAAWFADEPRMREAARLLLPLAQKERPKKPSKGGGGRKAAEPAAPAAGLTRVEPAMLVAGASRGPSNRPMPMVQGSDYLSHQIDRRHRRQVYFRLGGLLLILIAVVGTIAVGVTSRIGVLHVQPWLIFVIGLPFLGLLYWLFDQLQNAVQDAMQEERSFRQGREAERSVARLLRQGLNDQWTLFMNVQIPGGGGDIDMVLLGPPGIFTLEVKALHGRFSLRGDRWFRKTMMGWQFQRRNPARQARATATQLHEYIREHLKRDIWVEPRLVWAGEGQLELHQPAVFVWVMDRLPEETKRLRTLAPRLGAEERGAVAALLRGLCSALK